MEALEVALVNVTVAESAPVGAAERAIMSVIEPGEPYETVPESGATESHDAFVLAVQASGAPGSVISTEAVAVEEPRSIEVSWRTRAAATVVVVVVVVVGFECPEAPACLVAFFSLACGTAIVVVTMEATGIVGSGAAGTVEVVVEEARPTGELLVGIVLEEVTVVVVLGPEERCASS